MRYIVLETWHETTRVVDDKSKFQHIAIYHNAMTNQNNHLPFSVASHGSCCIHGTPYTFLVTIHFPRSVLGFFPCGDTHLRIYSDQFLYCNFSVKSMTHLTIREKCAIFSTRLRCILILDQQYKSNKHYINLTQCYIMT